MYSFFVSLCNSISDCLLNFLKCYHYGDYAGCVHYIRLLEDLVLGLKEAYCNEKKESES